MIMTFFRGVLKKFHLIWGAEIGKRKEFQECSQRAVCDLIVTSPHTQHTTFNIGDGACNEDEKCTWHFAGLVWRPISGGHAPRAHSTPVELGRGHHLQKWAIVFNHTEALQIVQSFIHIPFKIQKNEYLLQVFFLQSFK